MADVIGQKPQSEPDGCLRLGVGLIFIALVGIFILIILIYAQYERRQMDIEHRENINRLREETEREYRRWGVTPPPPLR